MYSRCLLQTISLTIVFGMGIACGQKEQAKTSSADSTAAMSMHAAPADSNRGMASATFGEAKVSIDYGRPRLRGRDMLAKATGGMIWRMGMNEATEISTDADLKFGETVIPKGNYSLWMKKLSDNAWELIFNKRTGLWGDEYPAEDSLAAVPLSVSTSPDTVEAFTIELSAKDADSGTLKAVWGTTAVTAEFEVQGGGK